MSLSEYIISKGLKLLFNDSKNSWSIVDGTTITHLGTEKQCMEYLMSLQTV